MSFIHLRLQSSYSLLQSTLTIDNIVNLAKENKMAAVCMSDRGNLFGSLEFAIQAAKNGVQPIHGVVLNILYDNNFTQNNHHSSSKNTDELELPDNFAEILLIAKNTQGYKNLLKLVSYTFIKNDRHICPHITWDDLEKYNQGLIVLSGYTEGIIGKLLLANQESKAKQYAAKLQGIFSDNRFYFEIMRHNLAKEKQIEETYLAIAEELKIPLVATNNVLFSSIEQHDVHDTLLRISYNITKEHELKKNVSIQCYFKSAQEMQALFPDLPEAIENSVYIAKRCVVMAEPNNPMLPHFTKGGISEEEMLRTEAKNSLLEKLKHKFIVENINDPERQREFTEIYLKRLEYELDIICKMNFSGYFLIVSDFIKWSKENNIAVGPGRGSGAGSIVAWSLLITDLDPIKFGLYFERFLNPERISMPDFDIDFCQERREEVINYVRHKYGDERVGQIITFGKMQAKAVIKDVARVLGLLYKYADYLTELVPFNAVNPVTLSQAIEEVSELNQAYQGKGLYNLQGENQLIKQVLDTALNLEGLHRHTSVHAAGIVIAGKDLIDIVPLYSDPNSNMLIVQYSMKYSELAGLMKFDFLGLQTLTVITKCQDLLAQQDIKVDFQNMTFDDKKTYEMLSRGRGTGVFQFESPGMKDTLRRLMPDCIDDLIALGALYRPGPMENIPTYIACKHGKQQPDYLHPLLKDILKETYGVIIYQEQVMDIAKTLAGYSLGSADLLRRAMGKKIKAEMQAQAEMFINGAKANNIDEDQARSIFETVAKFAGYGFNKAHASAYAVISYQTAYLKANFPVEFLVASLNLDIHNQDRIALFIQEARLNNITVIRPDINKSSGLFSIIFDHNQQKAINYALGAIKNVTANFGKVVEQERQQNGDFKSIIDFVERTPIKLLNTKLLENLIKAGCFDELHNNRNDLLYSVARKDYNTWLNEQTLASEMYRQNNLFNDAIQNNYNSASANQPVQIPGGEHRGGDNNSSANVTSRLIAYAMSYYSEKNSHQLSLLSVSSSNDNIIISTPQLEEIDMAFQEFEVLGGFIARHPIHFFEHVIEQCKINDSRYLLADLENNNTKVNERIKIAGVIQKKDARMSARGRFVTLQLSDQYNIFDITIFSEEILKNYGHLLDLKTIIVAECDLIKDQGGYRLVAHSFMHINQLLASQSFTLDLYPKNSQEVEQIVKLLHEKQQNNSSKASKALINLFLPVEEMFTAQILISDCFNLDTPTLKFLQNFYNN